MSDKTEVDVALAEYGSLRQEIDTRATRWHQILTTQLIVTGAIFAYALGPGESRNTVVLLVLPFTSFLLLGRLADQQYAVNRIGRYVRVYLSPRVPGGLQWEKWAFADRRRQVGQFWLGPVMLAFPMASALGIGLHAGVAYSAHAVHLVFLLVWAAGLVLPCGRSSWSFWLFAISIGLTRKPRHSVQRRQAGSLLLNLARPYPSSMLETARRPDPSQRRSRNEKTPERAGCGGFAASCTGLGTQPIGRPWAPFDGGIPQRRCLPLPRTTVDGCSR